MAKTTASAGSSGAACRTAQRRYRVAVARALANSPELLLADEPTGSLDTATGGQILDLLMSVQEDSGATLIVVTHDDRVAGVARRVINMLDGRVVASA